MTTSKIRLLLVEDDPRIIDFLRRGLEVEGYAVDVAGEARQALQLARSTSYPLIILDRMLPSMDGIEICRLLRAEGNRTPILMLTARDALQDKIEGLKGGADDYLTKPFAFDEVLARIEALLRRSGAAAPPAVLTVGDLAMDLKTKAVWRGERKIALTAREFALLTHLMTNAGNVLSREALLAAVWGLKLDPGTNVVDVYIRYLRRKIDAGDKRPLIRTVRGFGYSISEVE